MIIELARLILATTGLIWDPIERRINCLAHVINLAIQKLISSYSQSPHFSPHDPEAHVPNTAPGSMRDEIGLLRAITIKKHSSAEYGLAYESSLVVHICQLHRGYLLREILRDETGENVRN
ncbi:hypothetical protein B0H17DRAFT_1208481 [Mycena rosella]|uniref:Uncharacterized protein n=1 Tax=Mycena rosella TaxID=1033263 RepID=A0AAD7D0S2_MYCRO|nr:hypothetical protein B0H17DRAFT_1208481 [Mycena rosella]